MLLTVESSIPTVYYPFSVSHSILLLLNTNTPLLTLADIEGRMGDQTQSFLALDRRYSHYMGRHIGRFETPQPVPAYIPLHTQPSNGTNANGSFNNSFGVNGGGSLSGSGSMFGSGSMSGSNNHHNKSNNNNKNKFNNKNKPKMPSSVSNSTTTSASASAKASGRAVGNDGVGSALDHHNLSLGSISASSSLFDESSQIEGQGLGQRPGQGLGQGPGLGQGLGQGQGLEGVSWADFKQLSDGDGADDDVDGGVDVGKTPFPYPDDTSTPIWGGANDGGGKGGDFDRQGQAAEHGHGSAQGLTQEQGLSLGPGLGLAQGQGPAPVPVPAVVVSSSPRLLDDMLEDYNVR